MANKTVRDVIREALGELGIVAAGVAPTSVQALDGVKRYNDMLHGWKGQGVDVGHIDQTLNDDVQIAREHHNGLVALLAVYMAPSYLVSVTNELGLMASSGWSGLQAAYIINDPNNDMIVDTALRRLGPFRSLGTYRG
jgi:hypothetical protein